MQIGADFNSLPIALQLGEAPAADGFRANFAKLFLTDSFPLIPFISINDKQIYI